MSQRHNLKPISMRTGLRIIVDGVVLYMRKEQIGPVIGSTKHHNAAIGALSMLEAERAQGVPCYGITTSVGGVNVQVDVL